MDDVEERGEAVDVVELTRERRGEIEAEAVDVALGREVPQRVHDQRSTDGLLGLSELPVPVKST